MVTGTPRMVTDGLVLYLDAANRKSYPGSGTTWTDLSATVTSGSLNNGPVFSSTVNGSIFFDGTNDHIRISDSDTFNFTAFTALVWFNSAIFPGNTQYRIVNHQESSTRGWGIEMGRGDYIGTGTSSDMLLFAHTSNNSTWRNLASNTRLSQSIWYHAAFSADGTNMKLYLNGVLDNSTASLSSSPYSTISGDLGIGLNAQDFSTFAWSGSIAMVSLYNRVLSDTEIFNLYETTSERFNRPTLITDSDALNFLNSANIGNETQQKAINDLVVDMKNAGLWSKMKAIYPFIGGTATSHKWNLKDPRDVDAAFRLTFTGGWTHSSTGATPNGTNAYADTYLIPTTTLTENNTHLSYYSRTNQYTVSEEISLYKTGATPASLFRIVCGGLADGTIPYYGGEMYSTVDYAAVGFDTPISNSTLGHYILSRTSNVYHSTYRNGIFTQTAYNPRTTVASGWANCNIKLWIAARNSNGTPGIYSNKQAAFASIGDGLTNTDAANLYTIVQKYQTTLGRQV